MMKNPADRLKVEKIGKGERFFPFISEVNGKYVASSLPRLLRFPITARLSEHDGPSHNLFPVSLEKNGLDVHESDKAEDDKQLDDRYPPDHVLYSKPETQHKSIYPESIGDCAPVPGREHVPVQTDLYLEELCDEIDEKDEACQTDPLLDRPASPLFVPQSSGIDVETQIYPGELFDFDREVQPTLEVLLGQTFEQAQIEVAVEDELQELMKQREDYEFNRNTEVAEVLRLQEQERRLLMERQKRVKEHEEASRLEEETKEKIAACVFAQNFLSDLLPNVYQRLESQGYFWTVDPDVEEIEEGVCPRLLDEVCKEITMLEASSIMLDSLIDEAVQNICDTAVIKPHSSDDESATEEQQIAALLDEEVQIVCDIEERAQSYEERPTTDSDSDASVPAETLEENNNENNEITSNGESLDQGQTETHDELPTVQEEPDTESMKKDDM